MASPSPTSVVSDEIVASALSGAFRRRVVTVAEFEQRKHEPEFAHPETLNTSTLAELSYDSAYGEFGDVPASRCVDRGRQISINLRAMTGRTFELNVWWKSTVDEVKRSLGEALTESKGTAVDHDHLVLLFRGRKLDEGRTLKSYGIFDHDKVDFTVGLRASAPRVLILDPTLRDRHYDFDFTNMTDRGVEYSRGECRYQRPYGWTRVALNVHGKYEDDEWLGEVGHRTESTPGEWPVSYHGTARGYTDSIAEKGYLLSKGKHFAWGKGIYSSPSIEVAAHFATPFAHKGRVYQLVFQNRVSMEGLKRFQPTYDDDEYWIQPNDRLIRPYGLCIRPCARLYGAPST